MKPPLPMSWQRLSHPPASPKPRFEIAVIMCPHGNPMGGCPSCTGGMAGGSKGGGAREMTWNECYAIGLFLKALLKIKQENQAAALLPREIPHPKKGAEGQVLWNIAAYFKNLPAIAVILKYLDARIRQALSQHFETILKRTPMPWPSHQAQKQALLLAVSQWVALLYGERLMRLRFFRERLIKGLLQQRFEKVLKRGLTKIRLDLK